jgi:hypothetical protein
MASAPYFDTTVVVNIPISKLLELPLEFGTSWTDTTAFTSDGATTAFAEDNTIDGWGTLVLPTGSYPALRVNTVRRSYTIFGGMTFGPDIEYNYEFFTDDLVSAFIVHDDAGTASSAGYRSASSTALPVELASFDAVRDGGEAILSWKTISELDNAVFVIEHAVGDSPFGEIAFVDGAGTVHAEHRYSYTVTLESTGLHRFRLRQVDLDGTFTYSPVVEVNYEAPDRFALLPAYPNPFNPSTTVAYELAATAEVSLDVYDALGQRVRRLARGRQAAGRYEVEFDAAGLPSGLYVYRLVAGDRSFTRSMVLIK